jgi:hypothetical protein
VVRLKHDKIVTTESIDEDTLRELAQFEEELALMNMELEIEQELQGDLEVVGKSSQKHY